MASFTLRGYQNQYGWASPSEQFWHSKNQGGKKGGKRPVIKSNPKTKQEDKKKKEQAMFDQQKALQAMDRRSKEYQNAKKELADIKRTLIEEEMDFLNERKAAMKQVSNKLAAMLGKMDEASAQREAQLKRAYKQMSKKHHPDKHGGSNELFQRVAQAYETLRDPERRRLYDEGDDVKRPLKHDGEPASQQRDVGEGAHLEHGGKCNRLGRSDGRRPAAHLRERSDALWHAWGGGEVDGSKHALHAVCGSSYDPAFLLPPECPPEALQMIPDTFQMLPGALHMHPDWVVCIVK